MPIIFQVLHKAHSMVAGSPILSRGVELKPHITAALSFAITAVEVPAKVLGGKSTLETPDWAQGYMCSQAFKEAMWTPLWSKLDPYAIIYDLDNKLLKGNAVEHKYNADRKWSNHTTNAQASEALNSAFHLLGYDNGVFSSFIKPAQSLLVLVGSIDEDDALDIKDDVTKAVVAALKAAEKLYAGVLQTGHPDAKMPNSGKSLLDSSDPYYQTMKDIQRDLLDNRQQDTRFRRKAAKRKAVEDQLSTGITHTTTPLLQILHNL